MVFDRQYMCRLKDSTVYALRIAQKDGKTYVTCVAEYTDTAPVEKTPVNQGGKVESDEELKEKEAKLLARDNAKKFTTDHQGWAYQIADWKAKNLTKKLGDLLENEEKPKENAVKPVPAIPDVNAVSTVTEPNTVTPKTVAVPEIKEPNAVTPDSNSVPKVEEPNTAGSSKK